MINSDSARGDRRKLKTNTAEQHRRLAASIVPHAPDQIVTEIRMLLMFE
jgi:hypothetical protein